MSRLWSRARTAPSILVLVLVWFLSGHSFGAQTQNRWINSGDGLWRSGSNWSSNTPPDSSFSLVLITNAGSKRVTLDEVTLAANRMAQKLTVSGPGGTTNTLEVSGLGTNQPLTLTGTLSVDRGGTLVITNSGIYLDGTTGGILSIPAGNVLLETGLLDCSTTTASKIGTTSGASGTLVMNGGTMRVFQMQLGAGAGALGTLQIADGSLNSSSLLILGQTFSSTGVVSVSGGELIATNDLTKVGNLGAGDLLLTGGRADFAFLSMGENSGASGKVTVTGGELRVLPRSTNDLLRVGSLGFGELEIAGGTHVIGSEMHLADDLSATGLVRVTGGQLFVTNDLTAIGRYGFGQMIASNCLVILTNASVGRHSGAIGVLIVQSNAVVSQLDALSIGRFAGAEGHVILEGGTLALTNDDVWIGREGTGELVVSNGTLSARSLQVGVSPDGTNAPSGNFRLEGGTVLLSSNLVAGSDLLSTGSILMNGGDLSIVSDPGVLQVANGDFTMTGGKLELKQLILTNTAGSFSFGGGTLRLESAQVSNGSPFTIGDGSSPATLELLGGIYVFADGLVVANNSTITGCGTIVGSIINNGVIRTNCDNSAFTIALQGRAGITNTISLNSVVGMNYTLEFKESLTDTNWTAITPSTPGTGGELLLQDTTAAAPNRFYRVRAQ